MILEKNNDEMNNNIKEIKLLLEKSNSFNKINNIVEPLIKSSLDINEECELVDFNNNLIKYEDQLIKYFYYKDQVYFNANDIAVILNYSDTTQAIIINVDKKDKFNKNDFFDNNKKDILPKNIIDIFNNIDTLTLFINESGFYTLIFGSNNEKAKYFKNLITSEVLPYIRKNYNEKPNIINDYVEEDLEKYYGKDCLIKNLKIFH